MIPGSPPSTPVAILESPTRPLRAGPSSRNSDPEALLARLDEELRLRGYAERTQEGYTAHVRRYLEATRTEAGDPEEVVRRYLLNFSEVHGYSRSYASQCVAALRFFFRYVDPGTVEPGALPPMKRHKRLPTVLTRREVASVLSQVTHPRYRAILMLTYAAGLRVGEVIRLRPQDLDSDRGLLYVRNGKGGRNRYMMLSKVAFEAVKAYRKLESSDRWLFPGARSGRPISTRSVQRTFARARDAAGITKRAGMHTLRHSFATHLLERGVGLLHLQKLLGHTSLESTLIYIHLTQEDLTDIQSPLDGLAEELAVSPGPGERAWLAPPSPDDPEIPGPPPSGGPQESVSTLGVGTPPATPTSSGPPPEPVHVGRWHPNGRPRRMDRKELFERVWSKPVYRLANEWGVSNGGLQKACQRLEVPTPGRGYWQKSRVGKRVRRPELPELPEGEAEEVVVWAPE